MVIKKQNKMRFMYMFLTVLILTSISCSRERQKDTTGNQDSLSIPNDLVPVAFEDKGINDEIKSLSRTDKFGNNPIDRLFSDYLKSDEQLKNEIESFNSLCEKAKKVDGQISAFVNNNDKYYDAVEVLLNSIKDNDTVIYKIILSKVNQSKSNYSIQRESYQEHSKLEEDAIITWNSYLNAVKILKTLEMVEKYQKVDNNDKESLKEIIGKQKELTEKLIQRVK
jgi:uncharacterized protein YdcH (DUF465 family)